MKGLRMLLTAALLLLAGVQPAAGESAVPASTDETGQLSPSPGRFLVARRSLSGLWFKRTVVYLLKHDEDGTIGLIMNRPMNKQAHEVLPGMQTSGIGSHPLHFGGPVSPRVPVLLFRSKLKLSLALHVSDDVYASSSRKMLANRAVMHKTDSELRMFLGQSSWIPGQLEREIKRGYWIVTESNPEAIFAGNTDHLWKELIDRLDPVGIMALR